MYQNPKVPPSRKPTSTGAHWMWAMLVIFAVALGIVVGATVLGYRAVSSARDVNHREVEEETLLRQAEAIHGHAVVLGQQAVAARSSEAAKLAAEHEAKALVVWESYATVVEEGFVEETVPGQSIESIEAAMREAQALRTDVMDAAVSGHDVAHEQQALTMLDGQLSEYLGPLVGAAHQMHVEGEARVDSALGRLLLLVSVGVALAAATVGVGAALVYRQLRNAFAALVRERDRSEVLAKESQEIARHDQLTGLLNRLALMEDLESEIQRARRYDRPLGLAMLDIDGFKRFNDTCGHVEGDRLLQAIAQALLGAVRQTDRLYRYGGDEFILVMPETGPDDVAEVIERLQGRVRQAGWAAPGEASPELAISVSAGTAAFPTDGSDIDSLIRTADQALYAAKAGRPQRKRPRPRSVASPA